MTAPTTNSGGGPVARFGLGAPNEDKFGFVQSTRCGTLISVAGQVGKDNRSGEMLPAKTIDDHVTNAVRNVAEAVRLATRNGDVVTLAAATIHVPTGDGRHGGAVGARDLGDVALTVVGVTALASPDYAVEISATAVAGQNERSDEMGDVVVDRPMPLRRWLPGCSARRVGDQVFAGGHVSVDVDGRPIPDTIAAEIRGALESLQRSLESADSSLDRVTSMHLYIAGGPTAIDFDEVCTAHRDVMQSHPVAATLILVHSLPVPDVRVMVSATAT